jgi:RNA polymerase sigma factor (sigma-70 family)
VVRRAVVDRRQRSDSDLAADAAAGDAAAFAELYERHAPSVHGYCRRVLRSPDQAADATHEAFVNVLERLRNLGRQPIVAPRPYLFKAAHNACVRIATGRRHTEDVDQLPEPTHHDELSETERIVLTRELQSDVRAANEQLSLRHREVLALRDVEQLRYDQIARIMDITPNAAAQLAWRARARLRTQLRRRAFDAIVLHTLDCERALGLLELAEDPGSLSPAEDTWLAKHFVACSRCTSNRAVLADVGATYRSWVPAGAVPLLTVALLQKAGEVIGVSWGAAHAGGAGVAATTAVTGGATATTAATTVGAGGAAAPAALTAGTAAVVAGGGAAASVPTAMVAAAVGLAVGVGAPGLAHRALTERASAATPPALVSYPAPVRTPKLMLTRRPAVQGPLAPAPPAPAPEASPAVGAPPAEPAPPAPVALVTVAQPPGEAATADPAPVSDDSAPAADPAPAPVDSAPVADPGPAPAAEPDPAPVADPAPADPVPVADPAPADPAPVAAPAPVEQDIAVAPAPADADPAQG